MSVDSNAYREQLFEQILRANGKSQLPEDLDQAFQQLLNGDQAEYDKLVSVDDPVAAFKHHAALSGAELIEVDNWSAIAASLTTRISDLPTLAISQQELLQQTLKSLYATSCANYRDAQWGLALAEAGIAETGTLCLHSRSVASGLLFLVEYLAVIIKRSDIVARQEQAWEKMAVANEDTPRAVHLITGPSRTADVEQTLQVGAHGPRELLLFLLHD